MKRLLVLGAAVGFVLVTAIPALAWNFSVSAECKVLEEQGVRIVTFTIDNTSEPEELIILNQNPTSGFSKIAAGTYTRWSMAVPLDSAQVGASWEVLANWPSDQRVRHRVASVRFDRECPYTPPPTTTTTTPPPTTTSTIPETTTTVPTPTTTVPGETTTTTIPTPTPTTVPQPTPEPEPPSTSLPTELPFTGPEATNENARAALPWGVGLLAFGLILLAGSWAYGKTRSQRRHR